MADLMVDQEVAISGMGYWTAGTVLKYDSTTGNYIVKVKKTSKYINEGSQCAKFGEHIYAAENR